MICEGREKVPAAAYALVTDIEQAYGQGSRPRAADALAVSKALLDKVGQLSIATTPFSVARRQQTGKSPLFPKPTSPG